MPNVNNFVTNTTELNRQYSRYTVSRVIENKKDELLKIEVPADFSEALLKNNIEISMYNLADNSLVSSAVIRNTTNTNGIISIYNLQYPDNTFRKLLVIDFTKLTQVEGISFPIGRYSVTLNFFIDELGSNDNKVLKLTRISPSRTEVELILTDTNLQKELEGFATPGIPIEYITPTLKQIFNQEGADDVELPMSSVRIDSSSLYQNFTNGAGEKLVQYNFDDDDEDKPGINTVTQTLLDLAYPIAVNTINTNTAISGSTRLTEVELSNYVISAIDEAYDLILKDEEDNPSMYRFDLI